MKIQEQLLKYVLITAVEQGSHYWAKFRDYKPDAGTVSLKIIEDLPPYKNWPYTDNWVNIKISTIKNGIDRIASGKIKICRTYVGDCHLMRVLPDSADFDAPLADCILQAGLFNEIIYG